MVRVFCKPSIKALPNRILLVTVPTKHLLVAQRPRDVQVPTGALLGCVRGFDCFSSFMRDMKVFMDHDLNLGRWQPQYRRGINAKCTMRGGMRQISGGCVRCRFIATGPKCVLVFNSVRRPARPICQAWKGAGEGGTEDETGAPVDAEAGGAVQVQEAGDKVK